MNAVSIRSRTRTAMTSDLLTVADSEGLQAAFDLMKKNRVRHLPVVNNKGEVVGMLSERDLERAMRVDPLYIQNRLHHVEFDREATVADFMTSKVRTINANASLKEAALIMHAEKISSLLVIDDRFALVGILTTDDLLRVFIGILSSRPTVLDEFKTLAYSSPIGAISEFLSRVGL